MKLSLLVIRCQDLEISHLFYANLGFKFKEEKHGDGPRHYAAEADGFVFELYPTNEWVCDNLRLGFSSDKVEKGIYTDPDGRKIEIN